MKTREQIEASIAAIAPAPADETLHRVAIRAAHWLLGIIADEHVEIAKVHSLYARVIAGGTPTKEEWEDVQERLDLDLDLARDLARARAFDLAFARDLARARAFDLAFARALARARARALARARARALDLARALARARALDLARAFDLDLDLAFDLARALQALLGARLAPVPALDFRILVEAEKGGLRMRNYHCDTAHCRAGWAITFHPMGKELEKALGSWLAGAVIYLASTGRVPDFFASDEEAISDLRKAVLSPTDDNRG